MATYTWSIPSGKEITGSTYLKDTDNYIGDTINDLVDFVNGEGVHLNQGITYDFVDKATDQTVTGQKTYTQDIVGNIDTATKLKTARTIGGVSFDGSANINLPGVNISGNQNTSGYSENISTPTSGYKNVGAWGNDSITATGNVLVNSAYRAERAFDSDKLNGRTFNWSGQNGQPNWVWGGNDSSPYNMYVYNPSNFNVNYATSAESANYATSAGSANSITTSVSGSATSGLGAGDIGSYAFLRDQTSATYGPGTLVAGSQLRWSDHDSSLSIVGFGTWRCMGYVNNIGSTVFLRVA